MSYGKGKVGDKIREYLPPRSSGLTCDEPLFTINQIPHKVFTGSLSNTRSILYVQKDSVNVAHIKTDMYATRKR